MVIIQDDKVLLLHQSVKDFLVGSEFHAGLAHRCVDQLIWDFHTKTEGGGHTVSNDDFLFYSMRFWADHAHMAQSEF
jgi:hypothetical protein